MKLKMKNLVAAAALVIGVSMISPAAQAAIAVTDGPEATNTPEKIILVTKVVDYNGLDDLNVSKDVINLADNKDVIRLKLATEDEKETVITYLAPTAESNGAIDLVVYAKMGYNKSTYTHYRVKESESVAIGVGHRIEDGRRVWLMVTPRIVTDDIKY